MSKEAMKLALEALNNLIPIGKRTADLQDSAIKALKEALAKQEQGEPVAWMFEFPDKRIAPKFDSAPHGGNWKPLYTTPQQRKPLTDEQAWKVINQVEQEFGGHVVWDMAEPKALVRAILKAAHGIKE